MNQNRPIFGIMTHQMVIFHPYLKLANNVNISLVYIVKKRGNNEMDDTVSLKTFFLTCQSKKILLIKNKTKRLLRRMCFSCCDNSKCLL